MKLANKYVSDYVPEKLPWYKRDDLTTWYEEGKCNDFLENIDEQFKKTETINFDIIDNEK